MFFAILANIFLFVTPACVFLYFILYPESEACWTSDEKDIATPRPTLRVDDVEQDMAPLFFFWTYFGFSINIVFSVSYAVALRVPLKRKDLTFHG